MSNRHLFLMIGGLFSFASFFLNWVSNDFTASSPSQLISDPNELILFKVLFMAMLVSGGWNAYNGYVRKYNALPVLVTIGSAGWMLFKVMGTVVGSEGDIRFAAGYFLSLVAVLILGASLFSSDKAKQTESS